MENKKKWYVDIYNESVENEIIDLMNKDALIRNSQTFFTIDFWNWKFKNTNARFFNNWIQIARSLNDDSVVGHYAAIPIFIRNKERIFLASQSVDTITDYEFRQQGIFISLAEECYKQLINDKVNLIYGFPNENSYPGFVKKLGWKKIFSVEELGLILNINKVLDLKIKNRFKKIIFKLGLKFYLFFCEKFNFKKCNSNFSNVVVESINYELINQWISQKHSYFVDKSEKYFKWRYEENPINDKIFYKEVRKNNNIVGYFVLKMKNYPHRNNIRIAHIMEFVFDPKVEEVKSEMIQHIIKVSKQENADIILTYSHNKQNNYKLYKKNGFFKYDYKNFIIKSLNSSLEEDVFRAENWYISQGDSDRA